MYVIQITNAKKSCQITCLRLVIWQVFGMGDLEKPILTFPPHSILSMYNYKYNYLFSISNRNSPPQELYALCMSYVFFMYNIIHDIGIQHFVSSFCVPDTTMTSGWQIPIQFSLITIFLLDVFCYMFWWVFQSK